MTASGGGGASGVAGAFHRGRRFDRGGGGGLILAKRDEVGRRGGRAWARAPQRHAVPPPRAPPCAPAAPAAACAAAAAARLARAGRAGPDRQYALSWSGVGAASPADQPGGGPRRAAATARASHRAP